MNDIGRLFDNFATAYQHSLYAIDLAEQAVAEKREVSRNRIKKSFDRERSKATTASVNRLMANIHQLNEVCQQLADTDHSVIRAAEYLTYGSVQLENIKKIVFSDYFIPCVVPFLGHGNVLIESNGNTCQMIGLQFALQALKQTAPGQLSVTVINPELRPDFSACANLPDYKMLTKQVEISDEFARIAEELIEVDSLLQGRYSSIVELRKAAQQPVGRLSLIVVQDLPKPLIDDFDLFLKIARNAPRAGTVILFLNSKTGTNDNKYVRALRDLGNFSVFSLSGDKWRCHDHMLEKLIYNFPIMNNNDVAKIIAEIVEAAKNTTVITIPFGQIESVTNKWTESSVEHLVFNLGKSGLDTVSVCIGDRVTQHHNILISGAVGKGKSNLIEVMIHSLCLRYSPAELELFLLDFKDGLTFKPYSIRSDKSWLPHARMLGLESSRDVGLAMLKDLEAERLRRAEYFRNASVGGIQNYEDYRKHYPEDVIPRIVLVIDEYQKLFETNDDISDEAASLLENLVRQGRACAIHVILASQSINGAAGLLGKDERIYAQFPVRIALQNTLSESYALFGLGNDAAAQLRVRGEAVINQNYGAADSNQKFTVAFAAPDEMRRLRQSFCKDGPEDRYPVIFTRQDEMNLSMILPYMKHWRKKAIQTGVINIPCGIRLSVKKDVISLPFMNDIGKNIAILGAAEDLHKNNAMPGKNNIAIGILQSIGLSLALQHPNGDARFVLIDGLAADVYNNSNMSRWLTLMERFGFPVEVIPASDAASWMLEFRDGLSEDDPDMDTYIIGLGMDRCGNFTEMGLSGESGADAFQQLLKYGAKGVHLLCWWANVSMYQNHIGFNNEGYLETKILLRMDTDTARDVLGPFVNWSVRENRAYIHDNTNFSTDEVVIPLIPVTNRICGIVESEEW